MSLGKMRSSERSRGIQRKIIGVLLLISLAANLLAWMSEDLAGFYMRKIFPAVTKPFAALTSALPFSLGEVLIIIAVVGVPLSVVLFVVLMILKRKNKDARRSIRRIYGYAYAWVITYIIFTETFNCFVLYHTPSFAEMYGFAQDKYTASQLEQLAEHLITQTNQLSQQVERDDKGRFKLTADLDKTAKDAMSALAAEYPELDGYYATPKPVINSYFMSQQYLMGIYFPFTMEANYNDEMYPLNMPDTVCHELAHTKGFIREDEANFIGFLACAGSENVEYRYSGYLRALKYVMQKCEENCSEERVSELYASLAEGVRTDWNENSAYWQEVQESDRGLLDSEKVAEVSDKAMEASLKLNGVEDGKKSYGRMVDLLLDWYFAQAESKGD